MSVKDKRVKGLYIGPAESWIPKGHINYIYNIVDENGVPIGDIEIGTDDFVQIIIELPDGTVFKQTSYSSIDNELNDSEEAF